VTKRLEAEATAGTGQSDQVAAILGDIAERGRKLVRDFLARQQDLDGPAPGLDGVSLAGGTFVEILTRLMSRPHELARAQLGLWQDHARLWQAATQRMLGAEVRPVIAADRGDRRFKDPAWDDDGLFDFIKQSYLLNSKYLLQVAGREDGANDRTQRKLAFYTRQFVEMMAPSNFLATNPEVLRLTVETRGENLLRGLRNMLEDLDRGKGPARGQDDRPRPVRGRPQHRHDPGQGRLPDRPDAADPVRALDRAGPQAAADDHPSVDQQVLRPRPAAQEQPHQVLRRPGLHGVRAVLGQPGP
jgi:hypothetical protein